MALACARCCCGCWKTRLGRRLGSGELLESGKPVVDSSADGNKPISADEANGARLSDEQCVDAAEDLAQRSADPSEVEPQLWMVWVRWAAWSLVMDCWMAQASNAITAEPDGDSQVRCALLSRWA